MIETIRKQTENVFLVQRVLNSYFQLQTNDERQFKQTDSKEVFIMMLKLGSKQIRVLDLLEDIYSPKRY